jgi:hypothetical protein
MTTDRKTELEHFLTYTYMPQVYREIDPTDDNKNDEHWFQDVYIFEAVNSNNYDFYDRWISSYDANERNIDRLIGVRLVLELINDINQWSEDEMGENWSWDGDLTPEKVVKMYAYMYVMRMGEDHWRQIIQQNGVEDNIIQT